MAYRDNDRAVGERNGARLRHDPAEIDPRVIDLTDVTEAWLAQWHVPHPEPGQAQLLGPAGRRDCTLYERATHAP
jgi:hypothetical protein